MTINYSDIELAYDFVSFDIYEEHAAYLCKESGKIYYDSDLVEDELPADIYENEKYIAIPGKRDLDLGKPLVMDFVSEHLPADLEEVYTFFRSEGAYSRYKELLDIRGVLDNWYTYEQEAIKKALLSWCKANGIEVDL
jgi:Uncharacterised protein family (UPF0158)